MPEIDAGQLQQYQRAQDLLNKLLESPKHGLQVERIIKEEFPAARTDRLNLVETVTKPYDDKFTAVQAALDTVSKDFSDYKAAQEATGAETRLRSQLDGIRTEYGFTDETMNQVIDKMRSENLAHSPRAAAALVAESLGRYKAQPTSSAASLLAPKMDMYGLNSRKVEEQWEKLHSQPWDWFDEQVVSVLDDPQYRAA